MKEEFLKYLKTRTDSVLASVLCDDQFCILNNNNLIDDKLKVNKNILSVSYINIKKLVNDFRRKEIETKWNKRKLERKLKIKNIKEKRSKI